MDGSEMMAGHERRRATDHMMIPWLQQHIPWRVQVALILVIWFGPSVLFAGFFMAAWAGWIRSPITETREAVLRVEGTVTGAIRDMKERVKDSQFHAESLVRIGLATCQNVAKSDLQLARCTDYWKR